MARAEHNAFAISDILHRLERVTKEVAKSVDAMRGTVDRTRLARAREGLAEALGAVDEVLSTPPD